MSEFTYADGVSILDRRRNSVTYKLLVRTPSMEAAIQGPLNDPAYAFLYLVPADHPVFAKAVYSSSISWFDGLTEDQRAMCIFLGSVIENADKLQAFRSAVWDSANADRVLLDIVPKSEA